MNGVARLNTADNVAVALKDLEKGFEISLPGISVVALSDIRRGHKIALFPIEKGARAVKYGYPIGTAKEDIAAGEWVHTHNLKTNLDKPFEYTYTPKLKNPDIRDEGRSFSGYRRKNGAAGVRNELWVVPTVGCVNGTAGQIMETFIKKSGICDTSFVNVLRHPFGCSQLGDDHANTRLVLSNIVRHPNAGGVLVLGLGCENNLISEFKKTMGDYDGERILFLECQGVGDEFSEGARLLEALYGRMQDDRRTDIPLSELKVGLKCGGSDGMSGITANPLLGRFSDYLICQNGTTAQTEVPEMFGAEDIIMSRAANRGVFEKMAGLINNHKNYFLEYNLPIYENPSPGNIEGGITTLEDKALGSIQKGGSSIIVDVLPYGARFEQKGLHLLRSPSNDLISSTALAAAGCQIVLFTTGKGSPYGTFVPTVKVSTNTALFRKKRHWIDFNAGVLAEGASEKEVTGAFIDYVIEVANGKKTNNEIYSFREIAIFKTGIIL